jgi:AcrR family transcriptional regulator
MASTRRGGPASTRIARVARRILLARGHEELSLREVARLARLAPSSLYEHYANREALLDALAVSALSDLRAEVVKACATGADFRERLVNACIAYLGFAASRPSEFRLVFSRTQAADLAGPPPSSPLLPVVAEIERAVAEGRCVLPADLTVVDVAIALWTEVHGMAVLRQAYLAKTAGFDDRARQILAATIGAWLPPAPPRSRRR